MGEIWYFAKDRLKRTFTTARFYVLILVLITVIWSFFGGVSDYLAENDTQLQACELFILFSSSTFSQQIMVFSALMLLADVPFLDEKTSLGIIRSNKRKWFCGQILYCMIITVILLGVIQLLLMCFTGGQLFFQNSWSEHFTMECTVIETEDFTMLGSGNIEPLGILLGMDFSEQFLSSGSPWFVFGVAFLYAFLLILASTVIGIFLNMRFRTGVSVVAPLLFLMMRWFSEVAVLHPISPCYLAAVGFRDINAGTFGYTVIFFCCVILVFAVLGYQKLRRVDMQREIHQ